MACVNGKSKHTAISHSVKSTLPQCGATAQVCSFKPQVFDDCIGSKRILQENLKLMSWKVFDDFEATIARVVHCGELPKRITCCL